MGGTIVPCCYVQSCCVESVNMDTYAASTQAFLKVLKFEWKLHVAVASSPM